MVGRGVQAARGGHATARCGRERDLPPVIGDRTVVRAAEEVSGQQFNPRGQALGPRDKPPRDEHMNRPGWLTPAAFPVQQCVPG